jgi:cyclophilin family peptidyl-prolyl cis-trans isomerase
MDEAFRRFARVARDADAALFFYAGHALQFAGTNYLMPVDAKLQDEADLPYELAKVDDVIADLSRARNTRIIILDACRDNPLAERLRTNLPAVRSAALSRGLARIGSQGLITAFATQPGQVAEDGFRTRNSPFTTALLKHIGTPGIEIGAMFRRVAQEVNQSTGGRQLPELSVSLLGEFYFAGQASGSVTITPPSNEAERAWAVVKDTASIAVLEDFIRHFGGSFYSTLARARLNELKKSQVTLATSTAASPAGADSQNALMIDTKYGRIVIKLRNDIAPKHVERIKLLAREKYYDNVPFHRVIAGFMAQTGDGARGDGTGGSKYPNLPAEFSNVSFKRGIVGMARANDPNSANSQFFIMYADGSSLNGKYTVVGEVLSGMEVVDKIKKGEPVVDPDRMVRVQVAADAK